MSHFSVIVIGDNVEEQLQPYHEYECTGIRDQYVVHVDITNEVVESHKDHLGRWPLLADFAKDYYGADINPDGTIIRYTNPNAQWDWWCIGGRWSGWLGLNQGLRKDFDFEGIEAAKRLEAAADYAYYCPEGEPPLLWDQYREQFDTIDLARSAWAEEPMVKEIRRRASARDTFIMRPDKYFVPVEEFVNAAAAGSIVPYAMVMEGVWSSKGEMGWFGISDDKVSQEEWNTKARNILLNVPDDMLITVVDCHI